MKRATLTTAFYVLLVFVSGAAVGGFAHRLYVSPVVQTAAVSPAIPKPDEWRRKNMDEMRVRLSLSEAQMTQLGSVLDATRDRFREVKSKYDREAKTRRDPEMKAVQEDHVKRMNTILSETQQVEYAKLRAERDARRKKNSDSKPGSQD